MLQLTGTVCSSVDSDNTTRKIHVYGIVNGKVDSEHIKFHTIFTAKLLMYVSI
jgi:hypothetical protein